MPKSKEQLIDELSPLERRVLIALRDDGLLTPEEVVRKGNFKELVEVMNASSWLQSKGLVTVRERLRRFYSLVKKQYSAKLLPERKALKALRSARSAELDALRKASKLTEKEFNIAVGWMKRKGWAQVLKEGGKTVIKITEKGMDASLTKGRDELLLNRIGLDEVPEEALDPEDLEAARMLLSRQELLRERESVYREVELTEDGRVLAKDVFEAKEEVSQVTPELIQTGDWRKASFRKYDVRAFAPAVHGGSRHIITSYKDKIAALFTSMGFVQIEYDIILPSFWNMDMLFVPQDHPARELWDTFYLERDDDVPLDRKLVEGVRRVHEDGGDTGSEGWGYEWSEEDSKKLVLRSHTTPNTIRYLSEHPDEPAKVFSLGKCFRRDPFTYRHSPEFYQVEGIIMEKGANLSMLMGILSEFYTRLGFEGVEFKPSYFPFTEPSLEVVVQFKGRAFELAGAGIFRPEVTEPLGIKWPVLAWGGGLERLIMVVEDISDIREFYTNDLEWLRARRP